MLRGFVKVRSGFVLFIFGLVGLSFWIFPHKKGGANYKYTVGVVQIVDHPALDRTYQGFYTDIKNLLKDDVNVQKESAQGNPALALQIAQKFVGQGVNMLVALGTTAAQAARQASNGRIPVIFVSVTDPVDSKLVESYKAHDSWISGISNFVSIEKSLQTFLARWPHVKKVGTIYNPGESNSVSIVGQAQVAAQKLGVEFVALTAAKGHEVISAARRLVRMVDAVWINNDNTALASFNALPALCREVGCLLWASDIDLQGYDAAYGADQYVLGQQAAQMVHQHLLGDKPISETNVEEPAKIIWNETK